MRKIPIYLGVILLAGAGIWANSDGPKPKCTTEDSCQNDQNCQCYCSEKGGFRDKVENDRPVYIENDTNNVNCYCKQWDLNRYPGPAKR